MIAPPIKKAARVSAQLIFFFINEQGNRYEWSRASEEDGIPYGYAMALKANGWKN